MNTKLINKIVDNLSDDLLKKEYKTLPDKNKFTGHCYVASEAYYYLSKEELQVFHIRHEDSVHWFLKDIDGNIIDITKNQFKTPVPYKKARRGFFLTQFPSKRAVQLMNKVNAENL